MKAFSMDIRTRVLTDYQAGGRFAALARRYHVSAEWVRRFIRKYEATGAIAARSSRNRRVALHLRMGAEIRAAVAAQPDLTLEKLRQRLGVTCTLARLSQSLRALNIAFKKKRWLLPNKAGQMSPNDGTSSRHFKPPASTRTASFSSTKPGLKPT